MRTYQGSPFLSEVDDDVAADDHVLGLWVGVGQQVLPLEGDHPLEWVVDGPLVAGSLEVAGKDAGGHRFDIGAAEAIAAPGPLQDRLIDVRRQDAVGAFGLQLVQDRGDGVRFGSNGATGAPYAEGAVVLEQLRQVSLVQIGVALRLAVELRYVDGEEVAELRHGGGVLFQGAHKLRPVSGAATAHLAQAPPHLRFFVRLQVNARYQFDVAFEVGQPRSSSRMAFCTTVRSS